MSLTEYKEKRDFTNTPEPAPHKYKDFKELIFVVQRHEASHLHFDFRLEMEGALKSWAVPKGPSMNSNDKRLAVLVEDHPLEYASFAGVIPEGNYGAGTVEIWDKGTWEMTDKNISPESAFMEGKLDFYLYGEKLKGRFSLIRTNNSFSKNGWLLIKKKDEYSTQSKYDANKE